MDRLRVFDTVAQYESAIPTFKFPTISAIRGGLDVKFTSEREIYSKQYLTFEALESGTISFNIWYSMGTDMITSISYSTDNGETWTTTNNTDNKAENIQISRIMDNNWY